MYLFNQGKLIYVQFLFEYNPFFFYLVIYLLIHLTGSTALPILLYIFKVTKIYLTTPLLIPFNLVLDLNWNSYHILYVLLTFKIRWLFRDNMTKRHATWTCLTCFSLLWKQSYHKLRLPWIEYNLWSHRFLSSVCMFLCVCSKAHHQSRCKYLSNS